MFAIIVALIFLVAGVAGLYLLVKNMTEEGIEIAPPGSCKRGRCGVPSRPSLEDAEEAQLQAADVVDQGKSNS